MVALGNHPTDLTSLSPAEVDAQLFPILDQLAQKDLGLADYRWLLGEVARRDPHTRKERRHDPGVQRSSFEQGKAKIEEEIAALEAEAAPFEAEHQRRPWTRYLVVPNGHLHYRNCHTLTPGRTMVGQVAEASGLTAEEVVTKYNATACTHCFPDAPVADKKSPAEEGFCERSGEYLTEAEEAAIVERYGSGWRSLYVAPSIRCQCGGLPSITKTDKIRKHKPGTPK